MKKRLRTILLLLSALAFCIVGFTACTDTPSTPQKLSAPVVTLTDNVASWEEDLNADKFEISLDGNLSYVENTVTTKALTNGQTLKVRAIGDGINYSNSGWSNIVTYTANGESPDPNPNPEQNPNPNPTPTTAPTYLGILASNSVPSQTDIPSGLQLSTFSNRVSLSDSLKAYLTNANNSLGDTAPTESDYEVYSSVGSTVYIQIWLNNPDQNTILSLKLNGEKKQSGGGLQSFFIANGNSYLNCVYVGVTVPSNFYNEITYEVTEIEYVEGNNISQDGKDVLIDEDNDTVTIGLPYEQSLPTASISNGTKTATSITVDVNVTDGDNYVNLIGGWLRVVVYNQNNEILAQKKLNNGNNTVTFNDLSAETYYTILAFVWGDTHDGNGVTVHNLATEYYRTESVITCNIESDILLNTQTDKYYPVISVNAELSDSSFTFTKVEVCDYSNNVYYTSEFDGSIEITENILNGESYLVKVYYKNALNVEQCYMDYDVYVDRLNSPSFVVTKYGLINDAIIILEATNDKYNLISARIEIFDENSKQYIAEDAIYLIEHPNAIAELEEQWLSMDRANPDFATVYDRWHKLSGVKDKVDEYYSSLTKQDWEVELAKGIFMYEFVLDEDEEFFEGADNKYYVVLDDYQLKRINDNSWQYKVYEKVDYNDGNQPEYFSMNAGWFSIDPVFSENNYIFDEEFTLSDDNVVYLDVKTKDGSGAETYKALGYVNQIALFKDYEIVKVLWSQSEPDCDVDEAQWLANIKTAVLSGADIDSVFPMGNLTAITFDIDDIDLSSLDAGYYRLGFTYKMFGEEYDDDHPYERYWDYKDFVIAGQLPTASIEIVTSATEDYGEFQIKIPDSLGGYWNYYQIEVRDADEKSVGTYTQDNAHQIGKLSAGYSIRIKLTVDGNYSYYTEGEWSEWFVCTVGKCDTPTDFYTYFSQEGGVVVGWLAVEGAEKFVCKINGGEEVEVYTIIYTGLKNGDTITVKAVPAEDSGFVASSYSEVYTVVDNRTLLETPQVTFSEKGYMLKWQAVENAEYYQIINAETGEIVENYFYETSCYVPINNTYIVKAIPEDVDKYAESQSEPVEAKVESKS